ncbi:hypothetical protein ACFLZM_00165 [Thermodesulfobacteriota bacterium]
MTTQELNMLTEQKIKVLTPHMRAQSRGDDDSFQEQCIGVYQALKKEPNATTRYLKNGAKWNLIRERQRGRSIDNGYWKRDRVKIIHLDQYNAEEAASLILADMRSRPLDEQVIEKIAVERFFENLNYLERRFVGLKIEDLSAKKIMQRMRITKNRLKRIKINIRLKIGEAFAG